MPEQRDAAGQELAARSVALPSQSVSGNACAPGCVSTTASSAGRCAQGRAIAHDAYGVDDSASFADSAFSVGTSLIEQESTLAEYADHGRGCHSPKYMAARAEPGEYGPTGSERSHRPMPWDDAPASLHAYRGAAATSPKPRVAHHSRLLRGRKPVARQTSSSSAAEQAGESSPGSDARSDVTPSICSQSAAGDSLAAGQAAPRVATKPKASPSVRSSPAVSLAAEAAVGHGKDPATPGGSFRGRTNSKPLHRVKDLPHSRRMPWETQPARMRAVVAPRRVNHTTTPPSRQKELHAVGAQTYES